MTAPSGVILSPNYPNMYGNHDDCGWQIEVDLDHVVELTFEDFDVEPHSNCSYDYVAVFDGANESAPLLLHHCGQVSRMQSKPSRSLLLSEPTGASDDRVHEQSNVREAQGGRLRARQGL